MSATETKGPAFGQAPAPSPLGCVVRDVGVMRLRVPDDPDLPSIHELEVTHGRFRRLGDAAPSFDEWRKALAHMFDVGFLVEFAPNLDTLDEDGDPEVGEYERIGFVCAMDTHPIDRCVRLGAWRWPDAATEVPWPTLMTRAVVLLVQHLFTEEPRLRRIYLDVPAYNHGEFVDQGLAAGLFMKVGHLEGYNLDADGEAHDVTIYAFEPERWFSDEPPPGLPASIQDLIRLGLAGEF